MVFCVGSKDNEIMCRCADMLMCGCNAAVHSRFIDYSVNAVILYIKALQMARSLKNNKWRANFTGFMRTFSIINCLYL